MNWERLGGQREQQRVSEWVRQVGEAQEAGEGWRGREAKEKGRSEEGEARKGYHGSEMGTEVRGKPRIGPSLEP